MDGLGARIGRAVRSLGAAGRRGTQRRRAPRLMLDAEISALSLAEGATLRLVDGVGTTLRVLAGDLWITQDGDPRDIVLRPGERFVVDRDGPVLALPLGRSATLAVGRAAVAGDARVAATNGRGVAVAGPRAGARGDAHAAAAAGAAS